jgi:hypothetical protein
MKLDLNFGDYVLIEQKRFGVPNEQYLYKVIGTLKSNTYVEVPVQANPKEIIHKDMVEVVACVCCGVMERDILRFNISDVQKQKP